MDRHTYKRLIAANKRKKKKVNKYKVSDEECRIYNGIKFDSKAEMNRYIQLYTLARNGKIQNLVLQPRFELMPAFKSKFQKNKIKSLHYVADFMYELDGETIVEDVKGARTKEYLIKRKLFLFKYPELTFREITTTKRRARQR